MNRRAILDAGPLVALLNRADRHHAWARAVWSDTEAPWLSCEAVLAEACHLLRHDGGAAGVIELLQRGAIALSFSLRDQIPAVSELLRRYADAPMSLADACLVRMAELHPGSQVVTLDREFAIYRLQGRRVVPTLMPPRR